MKYGQIVENKMRNDQIDYYFGFISENNQKRIVKKFKKNSHDERQELHILKELQIGAYLCKNGFIIEYERKIGLKAPDWSILDESERIKCVVESVYHHIDQKNDDEINLKLRAGKLIIGYQPDKYDPDQTRLWETIKDKATSYKPLIDKEKIPYVISIFCDGKAVVDLVDIKGCLFEGNSAIFTSYPHVSGVMCIGGNNFTYINNPNSERVIVLPSGLF
jgi:hypothetical protein